MTMEQRDIQSSRMCKKYLGILADLVLNMSQQCDTAAKQKLKQMQSESESALIEVCIVLPILYQEYCVQFWTPHLVRTWTNMSV